MTFESNAIQNFKSYLQIKTVQPNPDYAACMDFIKKMASDIGLKCQIFQFVAGKPIALLSLIGLAPHLPSLLLNSHTDVVPVNEACWTFPPFEAVQTAQGRIYARGAQDMKCVGIAYLEAIRHLKLSGWQPERSIHISFVPDEEIGGQDGMATFVTRKEFSDLNIGFALDEGLASPTEAYTIYYAERRPWWLRVIATGATGHGSRFIENTATEKLWHFIQLALAFSNEQKAIMQREQVTIGHVTSINLTLLEAGEQHNIVPSRATAGLDARLAPHMSDATFEAMIDAWCVESDVQVEYVQQCKSTASPEGHGPWLDRLTGALDQKGLAWTLDIFTGATDARFVREQGIPALGFSPLRHTPILLHDHDEYLDASVLLEGIAAYCDIIRALSLA